MIAQFKKIKQSVGKFNINPRPPPFLKIEFSFQAVLRSGREGPLAWKNEAAFLA
jgi:hypothetical protein